MVQRCIALLVSLPLMAAATAALGQAPGTPPAKASPSTATVNPLTGATVEAGALHGQGRSHFDKREFDRAIELFSQALKISPRYGDAWHDRGRAHLQKGEFAKSVADVGKAIELLPSSSRRIDNAHFDRAVAHTHLNQFDQARADFEKAGTSAERYANQAVLQWKTRNHLAAIESANRSLSLDNASSISILARGIRTMSLVALGRHGEAETTIKDLARRYEAPSRYTGSIRSAVMLGQSEQPMKIRIVRDADPACEPNCREWISLQGRIDRGHEDAFAEVLKSLGSKKLPVLVHSFGGNTVAGMAIGRAIRARSLDVAVAYTVEAPACGKDKACAARTKGGRILGMPSDVGAMCSSSCVYILAAGDIRAVGPLASVGVHQMSYHRFYTQPPTDEQVARDKREGRMVQKTPRGLGVVLPLKDDHYIDTAKYYRSMGMDVGLMSLLLGVPNERTHLLTGTELVATGLQTASGFADQFLDGKAPPPKVVTLPSPRTFSPVASPTELTEKMGAELARLECHPATAQEKPTLQSVKRALTRYTALTGRTVTGNGQNQETLDMLRGHAGLACPRACPVGSTERGEFCVVTKPTP